MSTAIDRALSRQRHRRRHLNADHDSKERLVGLGSVILGRISEDCRDGALDALRLYSGLDEHEDILIHSCRIGEESEGGHYIYYLSKDAELFCESTTMGPEGLVARRVELAATEDFLRISPLAVEMLYMDLMKEGFWDQVAFKNSRQGKPGYEKIWDTRE